MVGTQQAYANAHKVLNTTELLEAILVELPIRDLLFSQRVCRTFKDTIANSIRLQQALFLAAEPSITEAAQLRLHQLTINPLFDGPYQNGRLKHSFVLDDGSLRLCQVRIGAFWSASPYQASLPINIYLPEAASVLVGNKVHQLDSWRDMYLSQPPNPVWVNLIRRNRVLQFGVGAVTLGELFTKVAEEMKRLD
jgi:hypothetical protein